MVTSKPNIRCNTTNAKLNTTQYVIEQSNKIKILDIIVTSGLCNNAYISVIFGKVTYRLNLLKKVIKYANYRTTKMLFNSLIIWLFLKYLEKILELIILNDLNY